MFSLEFNGVIDPPPAPPPKADILILLFHLSASHFPDPSKEDKNGANLIRSFEVKADNLCKSPYTLTKHGL